MKKSMYSLILDDAVIQKIDDLAHRRGTSRSGLVNQILADNVSYITPEQWVHSVFVSLRESVAQNDILPEQASARVLHLKSVLPFRYNPILRYTIDFSPKKGHCQCEFRAISRTKSDALLSRLTVFCEIWSQIEMSQCGDKLPGGMRVSIQNGSFQRGLMVEHNGEPREAKALGNAIGRYTSLFDKMLKMSFEAEYGIDMQVYSTMIAHFSDYVEASSFLV